MKSNSGRAVPEEDRQRHEDCHSTIKHGTGGPLTLACHHQHTVQKEVSPSQLHAQPTEIATTMSMWWTHGRERDLEQSEHYEERWNRRLEGGEEETFCEWPALSPVLRLHPAKGHDFVFMATQQQGLVPMSMTRATSREHGEVPGQGSCLGSHSCPPAVQNWPGSSLVVALWSAGPICHQ